MLYAPSNTASDNKVRYERKVHQEEGSLAVKERQISSIYTFNLETKSLLSDRAWVNIEPASLFSVFFLTLVTK